MPTYEYSCAGCRDKQERFLKLADFDTPQHCEKCGTVLQRLISAPAVVGDYPGYECPVSGKWIEGRRAHEENLKRTGCRVYEPGETQEFATRRRRENEAQEDAMAETAAKLVEQLPQDKKVELAKELEHGADLTFTRATVGE